MNSLDRRRLRDNYVELVRNLNPEDVMDYLYQEQVLSEEDCENIRSGTTRAQRMRIFLSILPTRKSDGLKKLIEAMTRSGYEDLLEIINAEAETTPVLNGVACQVPSPTEDLCECENPLSEDLRFFELREQLEQQSEVVASMQLEMEQLQTELKRQSQSQSQANDEKYKKTVAVLQELEKEKAEKQRVYNEIYETLLKDLEKVDDCEKEKSSRASTLSRPSRPQRQSSFRTPSFTLGGLRQHAKIKCVLVGDGGTGKTSIIHYFIHKQRLQSYVPTVFDNRCVDITNGNTLVSVNFWDTAGQEAYDKLRPLSYADAHVVLLVFSITSQTTLNNVLAKWHPEIKHYCKKTPIILVGNKTDPIEDQKLNSMRRDGQRLVEAKEANMAAQVMKASTSQAFLCSAFTGDGIQKLLDHLVGVGLRRLLRVHRKKNPCSCM